MAHYMIYGFSRRLDERMNHWPLYWLIYNIDVCKFILGSIEASQTAIWHWFVEVNVQPKWNNPPLKFPCILTHGNDVNY